MVWLVFVTVLVLWSELATAQSDALRDLLNKLAALYEQSKYADAIPFANRL